MRASDALAVTTTAVFDLANAAIAFYSEHHEDFWPLKPAIYFKQNSQPVLLSNRRYFDPNGLEIHDPLNTVWTLNDAIYDEDSALILPKYIMKRPERYLSHTPRLFMPAVEVLRIAIDHFIEDVTVYHSATGLSELGQYLTPVGVSAYYDSVYDRFYQQFFEPVEDWIRPDIHHIYFLQLEQHTLMVQKACDYRVYDWLCRMESGEWHDAQASF